MSSLHEQLLRGLMLYAPAAMLCLLGLVITLRSGNVSLGTTHGLRKLANNASLLVVRLVLWIALILAVVELVGAGVLLRSQ